MLEKLRQAIKYDPETGLFTRLSKHAEKAYMHPNANGAPRVSVLGKEYSSRSLAWYLMTGYYPGPFELKSLDGNLSNVKWSNLYRTKENHKFCSQCKEEKPLDAYGKNKSRTAGHEPVCKECKKVKGKIYARKTGLKQFGLTQEGYNELLEKQNSVCGICEKVDKSKNLAVDHCHSSGKVRGLLCSKCNQGLGMFRDDVRLLYKAINYLSP